MNQYHFTQQDFDVFTIEGLEPRMEALIAVTRPKLNALGDYFSQFLTQQTGDTYYAHVAKHLRRKTNPPEDTWVAFATNKRGYKMLPHFQIGLFGSHVFVLYGVIYESPEKRSIAERWKNNIEQILSLPAGFVMKKDHMKQDFVSIDDLSKETLEEALNRLKTVKKGELLFGKIYYPDDDALTTDETFIDELEQTFHQLIALT